MKFIEKQQNDDLHSKISRKNLEPVSQNKFMKYHDNGISRMWAQFFNFPSNVMKSLCVPVVITSSHLTFINGEWIYMEKKATSIRLLAKSKGFTVTQLTYKYSHLILSKPNWQCQSVCLMWKLSISSAVQPTRKANSVGGFCLQHWPTAHENASFSKWWTQRVTVCTKNRTSLAWVGEQLQKWLIQIIFNLPRLHAYFQNYLYILIGSIFLYFTYIGLGVTKICHHWRKTLWKVGIFILFLEFQVANLGK